MVVQCIGSLELLVSRTQTPTIPILHRTLSLEVLYDWNPAIFSLGNQGSEKEMLLL